MESYKIRQEEEVNTIKAREYKLKLSEADVKRLAEKALSYGLTASELLENFIGDLVDGTYTNGSDERMYASEWAERCWFACESPEKNLTMFLFNRDCQLTTCYSYDDLLDIMERIDSTKEDICISEKEISNPREDWTDIVIWNHEKQEYVEYSSVEEYIESEKECLYSYQVCLEAAEKELQDLKDLFDEYMDGKEYSWENEIAECQKWYNENIGSLLEAPDEKQLTLVGPCNGRGR